MFSRRPDRPREEPRFAPPSGARPTDLIAAPPMAASPWGGIPTGPDPGYGPRREDVTVVAERDEVEGTLVSGQGVLVLGSYIGRIESATWIRIGETAVVRADLVADEIMVAGRYEGRLIANARLEITPTGQLRGDIHAPRLLLHEGGFIDGALSMSPLPAAPDPGARRPEVPGVIPVEGGTASPRDPGASPSPRGTAESPEPVPAVPVAALPGAPSDVPIAGPALGPAAAPSAAAPTAAAGAEGVASSVPATPKAARR